MSRKLKVTMTLDAGLVALADEAAWLARLSRSAWVEGLLEDALAGRGLNAGAGESRPSLSHVPRPVSASEVVPDWKGGKP